MSNEQNSQLRRALDFEDQEDGVVSTCSSEGVKVLASKSQKGKKKSKSWTRDAHRTRGASKRAQSIGVQEEQEREESVVAHIYERDPKNYGEAMRSSKREGWEIAMREEIEALEENKVWRLVKRSPSSNALHTKWVFKTKTDAHGDLERLKARLVCVRE